MSGLPTPACPDCGAPMRAANRRQGGQSFWGCSRYPVCRGSRPMPSLAEQIRSIIAAVARMLRRPWR